MEGEWSCYRGGHYWRENDHVTEVVSVMEVEWSYYSGFHFNGGRMVICI